MLGKLDGERQCIFPGLRMYLVQELNVDTVGSMLSDDVCTPTEKGLKHIQCTTGANIFSGICGNIFITKQYFENHLNTN